VYGMRSATCPGKTTGYPMSEREQRDDEVRDDPSEQHDLQRDIPRGTDEHAKDSPTVARESEDASDTLYGERRSRVEKPER